LYVAWVLPLEPVIVPKPCGSEVPAAATAGPDTGGQYVRHEPVQFDFVGVSIANQYSVLPWAFVSTLPLLVLCVITVVPEPLPWGVEALAGAEVPVEGVDALVEGEPELPHAASKAAPPATIGAAHHRLRIATSPFL
jgi:hypothetical protein